MIACSKKFLLQCSFWQSFALVSVSITAIASIILLALGFTGWNLFFKICISLGCITCLCWWIWCIKKIKDIATWWADLHNTINITQNLLVETKQDIKTIKQSYKQENSLFG